MQSGQAVPAQKMQDHVGVNNVNTTAENLPTTHPSRRVWGDYTTEDIHQNI